MEKKKVSIDELVQVLLFAISLSISKKEVKSFAKTTIRYRVKYDVLFSELVSLNMWIICDICELAFKSSPGIKECLGKLHRLVFGKFVKTKRENIFEWMNGVENKYIEYDKAFSTKHPSGPFWVLAKTITKNLFGEIKMDPILLVKISAYVGSLRVFLLREIGKFEII